MRGIFILPALLAGATALAEPRRIALLAGHPFGGEGLVPLRYVANDLERMRDVLELLGGFEPADVVTSFGEDADELAARFADIESVVHGHKLRTGDESLFVFYYSGHAQDGELRLGDSRLPLGDLKSLIEKSQASLRVALLDACRAGSITRLKGAIKGAPIDMAVEDAAAQRGLVLITASSDNEDAQESDEIQGSFFTHFLASGLRGAADADKDGAVTLSEAYNHAYASTVDRTVGTKGGIQHPTYRFDLRGAGDLVLTRVGSLSSAVAFPAAMTGTFVIFDVDSKVVVAELQKSDPARLQVAVRPGRYVVKKRERDHVLLQPIAVGQRAVVEVDATRMQKVAFADDWAKGASVSVEEARHGRLGVRVSTGFGGQSFLSAPARREYFPNLGLFKVTLDFDNLLRRQLGVRVDFGFGGSGSHALSLRDDFLGDLDYVVNLTQVTAGAALVWQHRIHRLATVGAHGRIGVVALTREFEDGGLPDQRFSTLTPGFGLESALHLNDWLRAGLHATMHYMFFNNPDEPLNLAFVEGGLLVTAVLR